MGYPFFTCYQCGTQWDDNGHIVNSIDHKGCLGCNDNNERIDAEALLDYINKKHMEQLIEHGSVRGGMS